MRTLKLPPLSSLRLFEASSRLLSFKNAASELLLTPSAVSHGIQTLEDWLGVPLFHRTSRGLVLTDAGQSYSRIVREALEMLARGTASVGAVTSHRRLMVSAAPTFADRWLLPRLKGFRAQFPEIAVTIDTSHERAELSEGGADVAIRMGTGDWSELSAELLMNERLVPVCAPEILDRVKNLTEIEAAPLIHLTSVSQDWNAWAQEFGVKAPDPAHGLQFDTIQMVFRAAAQGLGVALGRKPLVNGELERGDLVEVWQHEMQSRTPYWLVCSPVSQDEPDIQRFKVWILAEARSSSR